MTRRVLRALVVLLALSASCASLAATERSEPDRFLIGLHSVGGLSPAADTSYRQALRQFGPLSPPRVSLTITRGLCLFVSKHLGLSLTFWSPIGPPTPSNCKFFLGATVTAHAWRTARGLQIGAPLRTLRSLYPNATKVAGRHRPPLGTVNPPPPSSWWWLTVSPGIGARPALTAYVAHEHVVVLTVDIVGH